MPTKERKLSKFKIENNLEGNLEEIMSEYPSRTPNLFWKFATLKLVVITGPI